jgi:hypothetical protein
MAIEVIKLARVVSEYFIPFASADLKFVVIDLAYYGMMMFASSETRPFIMLSAAIFAILRPRDTTDDQYLEILSHTKIALC